MNAATLALRAHSLKLERNLLLLTGKENSHLIIACRLENIQRDGRAGRRQWEIQNVIGLARLHHCSRRQMHRYQLGNLIIHV